eukprot:357916-Chlamydomonas_euryale.AAC.2
MRREGWAGRERESGQHSSTRTFLVDTIGAQGELMEKVVISGGGGRTMSEEVWRSRCLATTGGWSYGDLLYQEVDAVCAVWENVWKMCGCSVRGVEKGVAAVFGVEVDWLW